MRTSAIAVSLVILLASVACSGPAQPGTPSDQQASAHSTGPKRITAAITVNPPSLYGGVTLSGSKGNTGSLQDLVSAGLSIADSQDRLRPELAEEVPTLENGRWKLLSDGRMETSWTIRPQARWHDGAPFSAEDLAFTSVVKQDKD